LKKQIIIIGILLLNASLSFAQHEKQTVQFRFGLGAGIYGTERISNLTLGLFTITDKDSSITLMNTIPIEMIIGLSDNVGFGFSYTYGVYIEDSLQAEARENIIHSFGASTDFYFINRQRFKMYFAANVNYNFLRLFHHTTLLSNEYLYTGFGASFGLGTHIHLFPFLTLNGKFGYDGRNMNLYEWKINSNEQNLSNWDVRLKNHGVHLIVGLSFVF
jgi:hypothetical protein